MKTLLILLAIVVGIFVINFTGAMFAILKIEDYQEENDKRCGE